MIRFYLFAAAGCCLLATNVAAAADPASLEFYESEIRPILVNRCYECHDAETGPDAANLRLDYRGGWLTGGDSGPAIDAETPSKSLLLRAISYDDPDLQMPPRSRMPDREIELLQKWIAAGAIAPEEEPNASATAETFDIESRRKAHWAWQPVAKPPVPSVQLASWPRDEIDRFILAKLEAAAIAPADPTDRATWLRRVTYDLTGLPPTADEVQAFESDTSDQAHEKVVDRLLASPAFGECWGQHWLDLMRYAETKGHEGDYSIPYAWRYRDYVIRAFNANLPYDQFVVEQIAGDLLPEPRIDPQTRTNQSIQGTGWWHLGEATHAPVDIRGEEADRVDNQIDVFGKTFLGMTIACARCHDHKFDAIASADYYALCGFVQSSSYQLADVADPQLQQQLANELETLNQQAGTRLLQLHLKQSKQQLADLKGLIESGQFADSAVALLREAHDDSHHPMHLLALAMEADRAGQDVVAVVRRATEAHGTSQSNKVQAPGTVIDFNSASEPIDHDNWRTSGVAFGDAPAPMGQVLLAGQQTGAPLQVAPRALATNLTTSPKLTGLYRTRTFEVTAGKVWYRYRGKADVFLAVDSHRTLHSPLHTNCEKQLDSEGKWAWFPHATDDYLGHRVHVDFKPTGPFELAEVRLSDVDPGAAQSPNTALLAKVMDAGKFDLTAVADATVATLQQALDHVAAGNADEGHANLANWVIANHHHLAFSPTDTTTPFDTEYDAYLAKRRAIERRIPEPEYALALLDGNGENESVHLRGSHKRLAPDPTPRRSLTALGGEFPIQQGSGRLQLAHRIANATNPLTARVMVNRVWAHLMGGGIVSTVDNLGVLGRPPTHPELLDYLASEFVGSGWDTKQLIRRLVLSSTYRQASKPAASVDATVLDTADPANELLHATRVRRIPAESIRDALFVISGELDSTPFGPSVPVEITAFMRHNRSPKGSGPMDGQRRRSVYIEVRRNALNHFLAAFDKPVPFTTVGFRNQSNSAAQPLMLLNDPLVHHLMDKWAKQLTSNFADDQAALQHAYLAAFARPPIPQESQQIAAFLAQQTNNNASRHTAWYDVCLTLVNSKEFVFLQ